MTDEESNQEDTPKLPSVAQMAEDRQRTVQTPDGLSLSLDELAAPIGPKPQSEVLPQQYATMDIQSKYDDAAIQHKEANPNCHTSYMYPTDLPFSCVCHDEACLTAFATKEQMYQFCLGHAPELHGAKVQFMKGFWDEESPPGIYFKELDALQEVQGDVQVSASMYIVSKYAYEGLTQSTYVALHAMGKWNCSLGCLHVVIMRVLCCS